MARSLRVEFPGALYHVISRGVERKNIFATKKDRKRFIHYLKENLERYGVILYAYILMDNHYHIVVETSSANLGKFMHTLNASYVVYYNKRHDRIGPLLQGRYKALLVHKETYLLELSRYVHLNPVRTKAATRAEEYQWSSFQTYVGAKTEEWVDCRWASKRFGRNWRKRYRQFVLERTDETDLLKKTKAGFLLGPDSFLKRVKEKIVLQRSKTELPSLKTLKNPTIDEILEETGKFFGVDKEEIVKKRRNFLPRKVALYLSRKSTSEKIENIGKRFGISYHAVSKAIRRIEAAIEKDEETRKIISTVKAKL